MEVSRRRGSAHRRAEYDRLGKKTREREFVEALEGEFELSPRESRGVLELVGETFFGNREVRTGQVEYTAVRSNEGSGKSMEELRKVQILRMTEEAYDQGGLLTQEDLGRILEVSSRTIRRDVVELMAKHVKLYLRGLQRDIGKGVSHKVWIVGLYLQQKTYSEIERHTGHSAGAIKTYLSDFTRVLMAKTRGIHSAREIGFYIGRTERLVNEYLVLMRQAERNREQRGRLESLKSQARYLERKIPIKKGLSSMVWRLV